jgi:ATP-dependent DNA helicase PIF1
MNIHLPNEQEMYFNEGEEEEAVQRGGRQNTKLMAWFELNRTDEEARTFTYCQVGQHYVWRNNRWHRKLRNAYRTIARIPTIDPRFRELYMLRLLLLQVRGCQSFEELRTVDGTVQEKFTRACQLRGLVHDDAVWDRTMQEASWTDMPNQMRNLFVSLITYCSPSNPLLLWEKIQELNGGRLYT